MLKSKLSLLFGTMLSFLLQLTGCHAQTPRGATLTKSMLQEATTIEYYQDTGSLPPDYQWSMRLTVTKNKVRLRVVKGYGDHAAYDKTRKLSAANYQQLISKLGAMSIRIHKPGPPESGASASCLTVKKQGTVLFEGNESYNMTCNGDLFSAFHDILGSEMSQVMRHPADL